MSPNRGAIVRRGDPAQRAHGYSHVAIAWDGTRKYTWAARNADDARRYAAALGKLLERPTT